MRSIAALAVAVSAVLPSVAAAPPQHLFETPFAGGLAPGEWEAGSSVVFREGAFPPFFAEERDARRDEWHVGVVDASLGMGGANRLRMQAGWQRVSGEDGEEASGIEDLRLTFSGRLPMRLPFDLGLSLGAKLPNASEEERLGTDQTDLMLRVTASGARERRGWAAAAGLGILGHPTRPATQDDVIWLGGCAWFQAGSGAIPVRLLAEATGITTSRYFNDARTFRAGVLLGAPGRWGVHLMARRGLTSVSERWGAEAGITWPF